MRRLAGQLRLERGSFVLEAAFEAPGEGVTAVFGPSGSGKTTLLRCVAGLERGARGVLAVGEERWQDSAGDLFLPPHRRPVGFVFQDDALFPHLTVRGNLAYAARRASRARSGPDLPEAAAWLGLEPLLERRPASLSGGERKRVAIARALLAAPRLLLLDEPLSGLDDASKAEILPYLERLQRRLALPVLYVSHSRGELLRFADHVLWLAGGRVRASGPVAELALRADLFPAEPDGELGTVAEGTVVEVEEAFDLAYLAVPGGRIAVPASGLRPGEGRRLRFLARDVSLALERPAATSILNVLPGRVVEVRNADTPQPVVMVDAGGTILLARITRKSLVTLDLAPGKEVFAQVKGVALV